MLVDIVLVLALVGAAAAIGSSGPEAPSPPVEDPGPPPIEPALLTAADPDGIAAAMQRLGYVADLGVDSAGDPRIYGQLDRLNYELHFYGCIENADCKYLKFVIGLDLPDGSDMATVNAWNAERNFGKAYLDREDDPYLALTTSLAGGMTEENFADILDWWRVIVPSFTEHVGFQ